MTVRCVPLFPEVRHQDHVPERSFNARSLLEDAFSAEPFSGVAPDRRLIVRVHPQVDPPEMQSIEPADQQCMHQSPAESTPTQCRVDQDPAQGCRLLLSVDLTKFAVRNRTTMNMVAPRAMPSRSLPGCVYIHIVPGKRMDVIAPTAMKYRAE